MEENRLNKLGSITMRLIRKDRIIYKRLRMAEKKLDNLDSGEGSKEIEDVKELIESATSRLDIGESIKRNVEEEIENWLNNKEM